MNYSERVAHKGTKAGAIRSQNTIVFKASDRAFRSNSRGVSDQNKSYSEQTNEHFNSAEISAAIAIAGTVDDYEERIVLF
ncbi:hypothetical protein LEP1GSC193_3594 [Leptospira alstonii serovar Pingchang str. 80-412]|uniref:Uncharacterized protein n=2 Tax=Leptospira alstonii TaxID=28452 RepID=M6D7W3_9LEPT|nr:hypothetical protein LEP1GSC194_0729 [Leptospira alstonii serovar Sichuan str. 79601]EQA81175.1 hypothetical protein LEP1GSC193_3594 [Leptospira alstonii serovar Pingchang str. 80-412]